MISLKAVYTERVAGNWRGIRQRIAANHILILVTNGECIYTIEGNDLHLKRGDALYVPEGVIRSARRSHSHLQWHVAHFHVEESLETSIPLLRNNHYLHIQLLNNDYLKNRFSYLIQHWLRKPVYHEAIYHCVLLEMLAVINGEIDSRNVTTKSYSIVLEVQSYIMKHYQTEIEISALAQLVERTPNYISTIFRRVTGQTITEYVQRIRIAEACNMLNQSHMSMSEISDYLGFCDQSYFNKVFRKITGLSPSVYVREQMKG
ncbi:MAG: AraC family transcriptional regulator [Paenibacillus sp.]|jgi:YesN/AraC family two-component response regulator|nr:AraC family transcriptional regulator [Paenibacillus sp.]